MQEEPAHITRMRIELEELRARKAGLAAFTLTSTFPELDPQVQHLRQIQLHAMRAYHGALEMRLDLLTK